jgi:GST-like protein
MVYLADKYKKFIPQDARGRAECLNWVFWQMAGQGPFTGGGFGHFFAYAPDNLNRDYPVAR